MKIKLRSGKELDDPVFDCDLEAQRAYVAAAMGLFPDPRTWDMGTLDRLLAIRRLDGPPKFYDTIRCMMSR